MSWSMKWRQFDRLVEIIRDHVPEGCEDREAAERLITDQLREYRRVKRQAEMNRGNRDPVTGRMLPKPEKPKRGKR